MKYKVNYLFNKIELITFSKCNQGFNYMAINALKNPRQFLTLRDKVQEVL
jgi:glutaredoxin-related protein